MRSADEVDAHVGRRLRQRRTGLGITQSQLGQALGLTFQQIQKYEKGQNRISAGRLFRIAGVLWVPVQYFFDGLDDGADDAVDDGAVNGEAVDDGAVNGEAVDGGAVDGGLDGGAPTGCASGGETGGFLTSAEGRALAAGFVRIGDAPTRQRIIDLVETLAGARPG